MLALADDAALARSVIAATAIPRRARSRWLRNLARTIEDRAAGRTRQRRHAARQRAELLRHLTDTSRQACDVPFGVQTEKHALVLSLTASDPSGHSGLFTRLAYRPWSQTARWKRGIIPSIA